MAEGAHGNEGVGCLTTQEDYLTHEAVPHIEVLAVDPAAQGRGVARALMHAAESWAREQGFQRISLNVWVQNERPAGCTSTSVTSRRRCTTSRISDRDG